MNSAYLRVLFVMENTMWHIYDDETDECLKIVDTYVQAEQWVMEHVREFICTIRRNIC